MWTRVAVQFSEAEISALNMPRSTRAHGDALRLAHVGVEERLCRGRVDLVLDACTPMGQRCARGPSGEAWLRRTPTRRRQGRLLPSGMHPA